MYFAKKSTCIESEGIGGILLNKLPVKNDAIKMLINADEKQYEKSRSISEEMVDFKGLYDSYISSSCDLRNTRLCSDLSSFKFIDYHPEEENVSF